MREKLDNRVQQNTLIASYYYFSYSRSIPIIFRKICILFDLDLSIWFGFNFLWTCNKLTSRYLKRFWLIFFFFFFLFELIVVASFMHYAWFAHLIRHAHDVYVWIIATLVLAVFVSEFWRGPSGNTYWALRWKLTIAS